ncbi:DNA polymerase III subunit gamma/tau [Sphingobium fluviale]|uniref:DNA polymerase III subunit gamma/tau n=1 Tax=Sphingobium fluviale TaxID=2506423 RepID=A0A4Q1KGE5_9SPHN|nr:DNA polymerase III subunit gamma/tau [Sphingobium fluviale]RXR28552.1 DNA polymerase III subunit gamma/tau [Sphingobium fluviale]
MTDSPPTTGSAYRVLARKYRPQTFAELIGQDAMVQTLGNAIRRGRLAHAFLMTGVRGVGKTSTARLIAKALNCIGPDGQSGPTIDPCGVCEPCLAIAEGRHIDVIEMDAASHTGVDDVREIIEAVRYSAVSARYKVYIIDEVHMLSKNAFNALLKTLEEPPAHVKFLFATTEVNKVPVTVLSRCQRFDLRRISAEKLAAHFAHVVREEGVEAEAEALSLIAQAAEGSARDGLSILDQAIAHAETEGAGEGARVTAAQVREMLGLSDRGAIRRLFGLLLVGDAQGALAMMREQHDLGVEPLSILRGLLETVHGVTLLKAGGRGDDPAQSVEEREALADWASQLGFAPLHRLWQLLLKGHEEVARAAMPSEAADMALLRVIHAASLPDPSELARLLEGGAPAASAQGAASSPTPSPAPAATLPASFEALVKLLWDRNKGLIADEIEHFIRPIRYAPPELDFEPARPMAQEQIDRIRAAIDEVTRGRWQLRLAQGDAQPTLSERREQAEQAARAEILGHPVMQAAMAAFPDAELMPADDEAKWSESA